MTAKTLKLESLPGYPEPIGRDLARLEDARARTRQAVAGLTQTQLDAEPSSGGNTAGTLLYHLAATKADWLYVEILEQSFPEDIVALFPVDVSTPDGRLSPVVGVTLETHLDRLRFVRRKLLERFNGVTDDNYRRLRQLPDYEVTPEWVVQRLVLREALHRGQILTLRNTLTAS